MENMSFEELLNQTLKEIKVGQTVTGQIININDKGEIFVDLGYKADGIIPKSEFSYNENENPQDSYKVGDRITADVIKLNDGLGNVLLSSKKANSKIVKQEFESKVKNNCVFKQKVTAVNDNGLIVDYRGIRIFIPLSLAAIPRDEKIEDYKGKEVTFRVIEYNEQARKVIGSIKVLLDEEKQVKEANFWNNIELGKMYKGTVSSLSSYGAFVDIDGVQGLLHISGITWERDKKPEDILKVGHHGASRVVDSGMLDYLANKISLISTGTNYFGHPNKGTLDILRNTEILRTDLMHSIKISTNGNNYKIYSYDLRDKKYKILSEYFSK